MIDEIRKALAEAIVPEGVESLEREEANAMLIANAHATELCEQDKEINGLRQKVAEQESVLREVKLLLDWPLPMAEESAKMMLDKILSPQDDREFSRPMTLEELAD